MTRRRARSGLVNPTWFAITTTFRLVRLVVLIVVRAPWTALLTAAAGAVAYLWGVAMLANVVTGTLVGLLLWQWNHRGSYRRLPGKWWARWWRRWLVYAWYWPFVAARHGLAAQLVDPASGGSYTDRRKVVQLRRVDIAPGMDRLLVSLPVGVDHAHLLRTTDGLAHALRATTVRVRVHKPGRVWLDVIRRDTLAPVLRPVPIPVMGTPAQTVAVLSGVTVGCCEDGTPWRLALRGTHVLVAGSTGSGKGSVLWSIVRGLSDGVQAGLVELIVFDPKGGQEFSHGRDLFAGFHDGDTDSMATALEDLAADMASRQRDLAAGRLPSLDGGRTHHPAIGSPHRVIIIDELATLTALADAKTTRRVEHALGLLLTKARAAGITVIAAVQDPSKDVVRWRNLFPTRIALRLDEPLQPDMVLGDGQRLRGAVCDAIPQHTPGVGFVRLDGAPDPTRVRATFLTTTDITNLVPPPRAPLALAPSPGDDTIGYEDSGTAARDVAA